MMFLVSYIGAPPTIGSIAASAAVPRVRAITAVALTSLMFMAHSLLLLAGRRRRRQVSCLRVVSLNTQPERVWMRPKINFCEMPSWRPQQDLALRHDRAGWKPGGRSFRRLEADRQQIARWRQLRGAYYCGAAGLRPQEAQRMGCPARDAPQLEGVTGVLGLRSDSGNRDLVALGPGDRNRVGIAALIGKHGNDGRYWRPGAARKCRNVNDQRGCRCAGGERQATPECERAKPAMRRSRRRSLGGNLALDRSPDPRRRLLGRHHRVDRRQQVGPCSDQSREGRITGDQPLEAPPRAARHRAEDIFRGQP